MSTENSEPRQSDAPHVEVYAPGEHRSPDWVELAWYGFGAMWILAAIGIGIVGAPNNTGAIVGLMIGLGAFAALFGWMTRI